MMQKPAPPHNPAAVLVKRIVASERVTLTSSQLEASIKFADAVLDLGRMQRAIMAAVHAQDDPALALVVRRVVGDGLFSLTLPTNTRTQATGKRTDMQRMLSSRPRMGLDAKP